jgi:putative transposon-encoded protein
MLYLDLLDRKVGVSPSTAITYSEADFPASFPYARWTAQMVRYNEYWNWFTGEVWEETIKGAKDKSGEPVYKFPLKVNLVKTAAMKHNYVLFGEVPDGPEPLVPCRARPKTRLDDSPPADKEKRAAKRIENFVNEVWQENNGRTLQLEGGLISQPLGGCVFKLTWSPLDDELDHKIKIELVLPDFFMPVWNTSNPDDLLEAFLVWRMPAREAYLKYGYEQTPSGGPQPDYILYVEHWTKKEVTITLGGKPLKQIVDVYDNKGVLVDQIETVYENEPNPFGFVPMVYIPRERAGGYYGLSMIDDLRGLAKEYNARLADMGDVIAETSHREVFLRNVGGTVKTRDIGGLRSVTDLGQGVPNQDKPDAFTIEPPAMPQGLVEFPENLRNQYIRDAFISSVAEGEDEGSQRSALTLAFRMWPITSKARATRTYWTNALNRLNKMIIIMAATGEQDGITLDDLAMVNLHCEWSPMIPRDREQQVNEVTLMLQAGALSPTTALGILSIVDDPWEELDKIKDWMEYQNEMAMQNEAKKQQIKTAIQGPVASTGLDNK